MRTKVHWFSILVPVGEVSDDCSTSGVVIEEEGGDDEEERAVS